MTDFIDLVKERRSASSFLPNHPISKRELNEIFELVKFGPSAFNLQHTNFVVVTDKENKEKIRKAAYGQYKVHTASAVIIVLGNKKAYKDAKKINQGLLMLGIISKQELDHIVKDTTIAYESRGDGFQKEEAIRNASLASMLFMLAAKEKDWDTCPMIGFDPKAVKEIVQANEEEEVVLMITIGKENTEKRTPRGYRKPVSEFVRYL